MTSPLRFPAETLAERHQRQRLLAALAEIDFVLPGSVVQRTIRCSSRGCHCHADPPRLHGPYASWTRKVDQKTVTKLLSPEQLARYGPWFDSDRRLRGLIVQLEALSLQVASRTEGWGCKRQSKRDPPGAETITEKMACEGASSAQV